MRTDAPRFSMFAFVFAIALQGITAPAPAFAESNPVARSNPLPTEHLRSLHKQMIAGRVLATRDLRALADAADGLAAFKYGKWLESQGKPQLLADAAHYYAIASYTDRDFAVRSLVALLALPTLELTAARRNEALDAMSRQSKTGNADAALALSSMFAVGIPFGKDPEAMRHWLEVAAKNGRGDAAVKLALAYMLPTDGIAPNPQKAREALDIAAAQPDPGTRAMAQTLLARLDTMQLPATPISEGVTE